MKTKHDIMGKYDYMKAHSMNFILSEKTNSELEHEHNVGRIDKAFYRNFAWEINGLKPKQNVATQFGCKWRQGQGETREQPNQRANLESKLVKKPEPDSERQVITESRTDYTGASPKRYTSKCYLQLHPVPVWYTESLQLKIGSTKRIYREQVYIKNQLRPFNWSETMITDVNTVPNIVHSTSIQHPEVEVNV